MHPELLLSASSRVFTEPEKEALGIILLFHEFSDFTPVATTGTRPRKAFGPVGEPCVDGSELICDVHVGRVDCGNASEGLRLVTVKSFILLKNVLLQLLIFLASFLELSFRVFLGPEVVKKPHHLACACEMVLHSFNNRDDSGRSHGAVNLQIVVWGWWGHGGIGTFTLWGLGVIHFVEVGSDSNWIALKTVT